MDDLVGRRRRHVNAGADIWNQQKFGDAIGRLLQGQGISRNPNNLTLQIAVQRRTTPCDFGITPGNGRRKRRNVDALCAQTVSQCRRSQILRPVAINHTPLGVRLYLGNKPKVKAYGHRDLLQGVIKWLDLGQQIIPTDHSRILGERRNDAYKSNNYQ